MAPGTRVARLVVALAAAALVVARAGAKDVVELRGEAVFDALTQAGDKVWFVEFYAPWCGHCKRLAPVWDELADRVDSDRVVVAKLDGSSDKPLAKRFGVKGFPTLIMFHPNGDMLRYKGPRDLASLEKFVQSVLAGQSTPTASRERAPPPTKASWADKPLLERMSSLPLGEILLFLTVGAVFGAGSVYALFRLRGTDEDFEREVDELCDEVLAQRQAEESAAKAAEGKPESKKDK